MPLGRPARTSGAGIERILTERPEDPGLLDDLAAVRGQAVEPR